MTDVQYAALKRYLILLDDGKAESIIDRHIITLYGFDALQWVKEWCEIPSFSR